MSTTVAFGGPAPIPAPEAAPPAAAPASVLFGAPEPAPAPAAPAAVPPAGTPPAAPPAAETPASKLFTKPEAQAGDEQTLYRYPRFRELIQETRELKASVATVQQERDAAMAVQTALAEIHPGNADPLAQARFDARWLDTMAELCREDGIANAIALRVKAKMDAANPGLKPPTPVTPATPAPAAAPARDPEMEQLLVQITTAAAVTFLRGEGVTPEFADMIAADVAKELGGSAQPNPQKIQELSVAWIAKHKFTEAQLTGKGATPPAPRLPSGNGNGAPGAPAAPPDPSAPARASAAAAPKAGTMEAWKANQAASLEKNARELGIA